MPQVASSAAFTARSTRSPPRRVGTTESLKTAQRDAGLIAIAELHSTQMTVGYREVAERRWLHQKRTSAEHGAAVK